MYMHACAYTGKIVNEIHDLVTEYTRDRPSLYYPAVARTEEVT